MNLNKTSNDQIKLAGNERVFAEKKLESLAFAASVENAGLLDQPDCIRKQFTGELADIRKHDLGRHRVYYTGHHTTCNYNVFFILFHKKEDARRALDGDAGFQNKLISALRDSTSSRKLPDPKDGVDAAQ